MKTILAVMMAYLPVISLAQSTEITCWTTKGKSMKLTIEDTILKIPDSVAAIDLCGVEAISLDRSSANPNCLYYIDGATTVEGLPNANVVCEGVCEGLLLTDEACFYCPMDFFATDAMLRYTPRCDDSEEADFSQPCHETVLLPFETDFVISEDVNGPMPDGWLQLANFCLNDDKLIFCQTYDKNLIANKPYLIKFEYAAYSTHILFCGQDKTIKETKPVLGNQKPYSFVGITMSEDEKPGYFRYHRGQKQYFIHTDDGKPMEPFRCFIISIKEEDITDQDHPSEESGKILEYNVVGRESTRIDTRSKQRSSKVHYDLQGRPLPNGNRNKGIYITGGIKVIK